MRLSYGFSQVEVARGANINYITYKHIEQGGHIPSWPLLYRLAWFYGTAIESLLPPVAQVATLMRWDNIVTLRGN